jgi:hypothetical protein
MRIWKDIDGYEGLYKISNDAKVWNCKRKMFQKKSLGTHGYRFVNIGKDGKRSNPLIHRLVAAAFIPNPDNKPYINHKDGHKLNNKLENLEWCTHKENICHAVAMQLKPSMKGGSNYWNCKLTTDQIYELMRVKDTMTVYELAEKFNVTHVNISAILNGKTWSHITGYEKKTGRRKYVKSNSKTI